MVESANILLSFGVKNILIKGGHGKTKFLSDVLLKKKN